jgi:Tol biopolymer transport system component
MNESMDRVLAEWLREGPENGPREGLERALAATRRVGQRPGWTFAERWLPMQLTMARTPSLRPLLAIVILAALVLALAATALFVGSSQSRVPPPFGPARNGAIVFEQGGDLLVADRPGGTTRVLVGGPETDAYPVFSNQGDRLAFVRTGDEGFQVMSVRPDGSDPQVLGDFPGTLDRMAWSPDGGALILNYSETDPSGFQLSVVNADGSGSRTLDVGRPADYASWRPDGRHIVFRGQLPSGTAGLFIADADGTNVRQLPVEAVDFVDFEGLGWSPDGNHLSYMSAGVDGVRGWQINIADIDADGTMTELRPLRLDPDSSHERNPVWSPDGTQLAFLLEKSATRQVGVFNADGSGYRVLGPDTLMLNILSYTWSPDGRTLLISEFPDEEAEREANRRMWSVDVASGAQTEVETPVATWQRLAP